MLIGLIFTLSIFYSAIYFSKNFSITGFTIFSSQPDSTGGKDAYIRQGLDTNFGTDPLLRIGKLPAGVELRSLIEFNLSSIPSEYTVTEAYMTLYLSSAPTQNNVTIKAMRLTKTWTESEVGWNNRTSSETWTSPGSDYSIEIGSISVNQSGYYNLSVLDWAQSVVNGEYENYGITLLSQDATNGDYKEFASSDSLTPEYRPKIFINYEENAIPTISLVETTSTPSNPILVGQSETFTITWDDLENNPVQLFVCNTSEILISGCSEKTFCSTTSSTTNPASCYYEILNSDPKTINTFIAICDATNCSIIEEKTIYANHLPNATIVRPNGGETINQSQGNYTINFLASDADSDEMNFTLYYGSSQNSTENLIATLGSSACYDIDADTSTANNCTYSWNTSGIYGNYYLTVIIDDLYITSSNSSASSFSIESVVDNENPLISEIVYNENAYSGKTITINATITDENSVSAWIDINYSSTNHSMTHQGSNIYSGNIIAPEIGTYSFKIYAKDILDNNANSSTQEFFVSKPNASSSDETAPSIALPYSIIRILSNLTANNSLKNVYAYLNIPAGFSFLEDYSQNLLLGDFDNDETKTAEWFVSTPIQEGTYNLNITYQDDYSNTWDSSNLEIQVTSLIGGGYEISTNGYPEIETNNNYYTESYFKQNGIYTEPDTMQISIYDSLNNLITGPASMSEISTGKYSYTYAIGTSVNEGQWRTVVNATKNSLNYIAQQFWKVVGGPFDLRDISITDNSIPGLDISFVAENTGGANKDLILLWNLTREDTGTLLDAGEETFMVEAYSEKTWDIQPSTEFVGQLRITLLGYYSGTEKIGAFEIFSSIPASESYCDDGTCDNDESCSICPSDCGACPTTPSGGGVGEVVVQKNEPSFKITVDKNITLAKNLEKVVKLNIVNTGNSTLTNLKLMIENLNNEFFSIFPSNIQEIAPGDSSEFLINFTVTETLDTEIIFIVKSDQLEKIEVSTLKTKTIKEYFLSEIGILKEKIQKIKNEENKPSPEKIKICEELLGKAEANINSEKYIDAKQNIELASECIEKLTPEKEIIQKYIYPYLGWIITWTLIAILIIALIVIARLIHRKISRGYSHISDTESQSKKDLIDKRISELQRKIRSS